MWRTAVLSLLLVATSVVAEETPKPFSVFARSQHYSMSVEVAGGTCNVTVIDLATNAVVAQPHLTLVNEQARDATDAGERHISVYVRRMTADFTAILEVSKGDTIIDAMRTTWTIAPHARRGVVGGVIGGPVTPPRPLPPDTYRVGGDVHAPRVISRVEPTYPEEARRERLSGIVIVETLIDKTGVVRDVQVLKPLPFGLDQAAVDAVKQWRFEPGTKDGQPVNVIFNLTVNFRLDTPAPPPPHP